MAVLLTASATAKAGRNGHVRSSDGAIDLETSMPKSAGGEGKAGATNPEQLFAAGYSACFGGALGAVAAAQKVKLSDVSVSADVSLHHEGGTNFFISVKLTASLPGIDRETAEKLLQAAHEVCPYSKATRNNVEVELALA